MRCMRNIKRLFFIANGLVALSTTAAAFEGRITAELIQGSETNTLRYTVGPAHLRIENLATNRPHAVNLVDLKSGAVTLVFPHNRSFLRLIPGDAGRGSPDPAAARTTGLPVTSENEYRRSNELPGQETLAQQAAGPSPPSPQSAGTPAAIPGPDMVAEQLNLGATGHKTNFLGLACERYEQKQRGETLEVWATDELLPFPPYLRNRPPRFGPGLIEEQWPGMLKERKLFPLLVSLRYDNGTERFHFEVKSVKEQKITDPDSKLFQPPPGWHELPPF
jgi:hypothetical protein